MSPAQSLDVPRGRVVVVAGPTAVGKGTVTRRLLEKHPEVYLSVSATTRDPRPGEVDGIHYFFWSPEQFDDAVENGDMLEWALVHGRNRYGTPRSAVEAARAEGRAVILEIDLEGARQVRSSMPDARFVFLAPPSWDVLVERLVGRGTESPEEQERRLETARVEMAAEKEFDVTIVNDDLDEAVDALAREAGLAIA
ncbi:MULTISPECIES: guanylate kinase [Dermabacter]|uniref:Guanylate kinase n=1 Tax=Dermabacter jinjuensis TaxID=1667168 RepID=A0ABM6PLT5_9MICO|nr:guanylate kinase [Dermabacter jinjuensis]ATH96540.1 guanylate kinase [Dermabacter jinjuensis]MDK8803102.1 guanylate kinase [Dermabacter hominis]UEB90631.1 guanylate kinase [Dermabacter jinjuensis]